MNSHSINDIIEKLERENKLLLKRECTFFPSYISRNLSKVLHINSPYVDFTQNETKYESYKEYVILHFVWEDHRRTLRTKSSKNLNHIGFINNLYEFLISKRIHIFFYLNYQYLNLLDSIVG